MKDYIIMDVTNGDVVGGVFETWDEAQEWIERQDIPEKYEIIERD